MKKESSLMKRTIVSAFGGLSEAHRRRIDKNAEKLGFEVLFFNSDHEAEKAVSAAEVLFSESVFLAEKAVNAKWICSPFAGMDRFAESPLAGRKDVLFSNTSGAYGIAISEHIVLTALMILRRQEEYRRIVSMHEWKRDLPVRSLYGSRIVIAGTGDIGRNTAIRMRAFSPASITGINQSLENPDSVFDQVIPSTSLPLILPDTDILILALPETPATRHLISASVLSLMPEGMILINVGRGSAIDQAALISRLREGTLYAGLDVFEEEPIPEKDAIWDCPNLIITPHCAGNTSLPYTVDLITDLFLEDLKNYAEGLPLKRQVNLTRGY